MVKYRDYNYKNSNHFRTVQNYYPSSKEKFFCLNQYLDDEYILKNNLYTHSILFEANPGRFDEEFLMKCFIETPSGIDNFSAIIKAIKTQNVSEKFIISILEAMENKKCYTLYYKIILIASRYVKLSESFIKEYIIEDDDVIPETIINVIQNQSLSEEFIEENLIDILNSRYYCEECGFENTDGWKFLFQNPNATISEDFFKKHNLMDLNLARYLLYVGHDEIGNEYSHIDLSHFSFNYLYKIFVKACNDVEKYIEMMNYPINRFSFQSNPIFMSFGLDFTKRVIERKLKNKNFPIKKLYPGNQYPIDKMFCDVFESFVLDEDYVRGIDTHFYVITNFAHSVYNNIYNRDHEENAKLFCWWICAKTQKIPHSLFQKIVIYNECNKERNNYICLFDSDSYAMNKYLNSGHIEFLKSCNIFDYNTRWLNNYEFTTNNDLMKALSTDQISKAKFISEHDLINYCNFVFDTNILSYTEKYEIFKNIMVYQREFLNSMTYEYFASYIKEMNEIDRDYTEDMIKMLIAFSNITSEEIENIFNLFYDIISF